MPTSLYRLYSNAGDLLYIGVTDALPQRMAAHAMTKDWWSEVFMRSTVEYADRGRALSAEAWAIWAENPRYNSWRPSVRPERVVDPLFATVSLADGTKVRNEIKSVLSGCVRTADDLPSRPLDALEGGLWAAFCGPESRRHAAARALRAEQARLSELRSRRNAYAPMREVEDAIASTIDVIEHARDETEVRHAAVRLRNAPALRRLWNLVA